MSACKPENRQLADWEQAGFLKSSPKITLYPKPSKRASLYGRVPPSSANSTSRTSPSSTPPARYGSPAPVPMLNATWVCPICSFSNPVPSNFDATTANAHTPLPPCLACGIKPPLIHVVKAAIAAISKRPTPDIDALGASGSSNNSAGRSSTSAVSGSMVKCPRCTFENHPSLHECEICGASLVQASDRRLELDRAPVQRAESPAPMLGGPPLSNDAIENVKFSFRAGGEKVFHERLKNALVQRKWLLQNAPPIPQPAGAGSGDLTPGKPDAPERQRTVGIAGLERRGLQQRKNNEAMIGSAFEDLEALMASAKEIIALAEQFSVQTNIGNGASNETDALLSQSASALGLTATKDMLGSKSESLYISELSRNLAEFLTDDARGILRREGGIVTLVDLWAVFNRLRNGVELISPADFEKAAQLWETLKLPIRLRKFKSGVLVVQGSDRTDEKTIAGLLEWLRRLRNEPPPFEVGWDWQTYGRGVTAQEVAEQFQWSVGVATEELEMAEEKGALCREQGTDGLKFWENMMLNEALK